MRTFPGCMRSCTLTPRSLLMGWLLSPSSGYVLSTGAPRPGTAYVRLQVVDVAVSAVQVRTISCLKIPSCSQIQDSLHIFLGIHTPNLSEPRHLLHRLLGTLLSSEVSITSLRSSDPWGWRSFPAGSSFFPLQLPIWVSFLHPFLTGPFSFFFGFLCLRGVHFHAVPQCHFWVLSPHLCPFYWVHSRTLGSSVSSSVTRENIGFRPFLPVKSIPLCSAPTKFFFWFLGIC